MLVLGIDTACDDTSVAVVEDGSNMRSNIIWSQQKVHARFGGVVPELAARRHVEVITEVVREALAGAGVTLDKIDLIGVNCKAGLLRSVIVGVSAAKALAFAAGKPLLGVHHIEGHIYSNLLRHPDLEFPHVCLTVSGGHNLLVYVAGHGQYEILGRTLDDAAGEAFDKVAKLLGLGFPGGPIVDRLASEGDPAAFVFPRPMLDQPNYNFSFSGLKTAVVHAVRDLQQKGQALPVADLAASFQAAVIETLASKTMRAARERGVRTVALAGGVSANSLLRRVMAEETRRAGMRLVYPELALCTDNGAMIACLAYHKYRQGARSGLDLNALPNAPLG
jgi:N6-L-threonylcarbamoyladenine synthase